MSLYRCGGSHAVAIYVFTFTDNQWCPYFYMHAAFIYSITSSPVYVNSRECDVCNIQRIRHVMSVMAMQRFVFKL